MPIFRPIDRDVLLELPVSLQAWLPEGHLARDVVEVVEAPGPERSAPGLRVSRKPA